MREHYIVDSNIKYQIKDDPESVLNYHLVSVENSKPEYNIRMIEGKLYYLYQCELDQPYMRSMSDPFASCGTHKYVDHYTPVYKTKDHTSKVIGYMHEAKTEPTHEEKMRRRLERESKEKVTCKWIPLKAEYLFHDMAGEENE